MTDRESVPASILWGARFDAAGAIIRKHNTDIRMPWCGLTGVLTAERARCAAPGHAAPMENTMHPDAQDAGNVRLSVRKKPAGFAAGR